MKNILCSCTDDNVYIVFCVLIAVNVLGTGKAQNDIVTFSVPLPVTLFSDEQYFSGLLILPTHDKYSWPGLNWDIHVLWSAIINISWPLQHQFKHYLLFHSCWRLFSTPVEDNQFPLTISFLIKLNYKCQIWQLTQR